MSHFSVILITPSRPTTKAITAIMQPWHEFECTGINDQFVVDTDITEESLAFGTSLEDHLGYHGLEDKVVASEAEVDRDNEHMFGFAIVENGTLIKAVRRTNPNKKWDWWVVGGRWNNHFERSDGTTADDLPFEEWALEKQLADAAAEIGARYDLFHELVSEHPPIRTFAEFRDQEGVGHDEARTTYWAQPALVALAAWVDPSKPEPKHAFERGFLGFGESIEDYFRPRDEHVAARQWSRVGSFAIVDARQEPAVWMAIGDMGWFGMSFNEDSSWPTAALAHVRALPPEAHVTIIDCHI